MADATYMLGRKRYSRPQALLFSNNSGTLVTVDEESYFVPQGYEIRSNISAADNEINQFMILSDHNRGDIGFSIDRLEKRERMINGRLRSYHIADKLKISVSYDMLPSRAYSSVAYFDVESGESSLKNTSNEYTVDGGAGGVELLEWYENHPGSFWVYLAYDKYTSFGSDSVDSYNQLKKYNQVVEMQFADFSYSVVKRNGSKFDLWNVSFSLEEV